MHATSKKSVLIGAGVAGVSSAIWLDDYGVPFEWYAAGGQIGGTLHRVHNAVTDMPGLMLSSGQELIERLSHHLSELELDGPTPMSVDRLVRNDRNWQLVGQEGRSTRADAVVVATGAECRTLDVPGEKTARGCCLHYSVSRHAEKVAGESVAVVGGGDAGFEGALILREHGCRVHMLLRSEQFKARRKFIEPVQADPEITIHEIPTVVKSIDPSTKTANLELSTPDGPDSLTVQCLFVEIGIDPVYPSIEPAPQTCSSGFIEVDKHRQTSVAGLYAVGDVTNAPLRSIAKASADGSVVAQTVAEYLELIG